MAREIELGCWQNLPSRFWFYCSYFLNIFGCFRALKSFDTINGNIAITYVYAYLTFSLYVAHVQGNVKITVSFRGSHLLAFESLLYILYLMSFNIWRSS